MITCKKKKCITAENRIGHKFNRWLVIGIEKRPELCRSGSNTWMIPYAKCVCDCGTEKTVLLSSIIKSTSKSCGCFSRETTSSVKTTHGLRSSRIYGIWNSMIQRCQNPNAQAKERYHLRGIYVAARWLKFENFFSDMGHKPSPGLSLDRIDNDGPYAWWNCRWATKLEQGANISTNRWIEFEGERFILTEWSRKFRMNAGTLHHLLKKHGDQVGMQRAKASAHGFVKRG